MSCDARAGIKRMPGCSGEVLYVAGNNRQRCRCTLFVQYSYPMYLGLCTTLLLESHDMFDDNIARMARNRVV